MARFSASVRSWARPVVAGSRPPSAAASTAAPVAETIFLLSIGLLLQSPRELDIHPYICSALIGGAQRHHHAIVGLFELQRQLMARQFVGLFLKNLLAVFFKPLPLSLRIETRPKERRRTELERKESLN
jgi:hypothetical protein